MVFSPILELGKHHAPRTPQPPIVIGSPRYYQVTGLKAPKTDKKQSTTTFCPDKSDAASIASFDSLEKPILGKKQPKSSRLSKLFQ